MFDRNPLDTELAEVPLLHGLSKRELEWVARLSTAIELPAGSLLAQQGEAGTEFFLVLEGDVEVVQSGVLVAVRGAGSPLGEVALLGDRPRTATLVAQTPVRLQVASQREFVGLLAEVPALSDRLHVTMAERLAA